MRGTPRRRPEFEEYASQRWMRLVRTAVLLGADRAEAEDLAQTTLSKAWQAWGRVSAADDVDAYVHRMLLHTFTDTRRRRWRGERPTLVLPETPTPDASDDVLLREGVRRALHALSHEHREVIVLRYYAGLSEAQMATVLRVAPGTVKSRLSRALQALRRSPALATTLDAEGVN